MSMAVRTCERTGGVFFKNKIRVPYDAWIDMSNRPEPGLRPVNVSMLNSISITVGEAIITLPEVIAIDSRIEKIDDFVRDRDATLFERINSGEMSEYEMIGGSEGHYSHALVSLMH